MTFLRFTTTLFFVIVFLNFSYSQSHIDKTGFWAMYFGLNRVTDAISIHTEGQHRNYTVGNDLEQLLLRTGVNYHVNKKLMLTAGYGHISSYGTEDKSGPLIEHRIWEQLILRNKVSFFPLEHRVRYEQRWINGDFRQRFRYRLMVNIPLNAKEITINTLFLSFYDEIFLNAQKDNIFDRNRLYGALAYQVSKPVSIQAGYLRQTVSDFSKDYLQLAIFYNPDFRK